MTDRPVLDRQPDTLSSQQIQVHSGREPAPAGSELTPPLLLREGRPRPICASLPGPLPQPGPPRPEGMGPPPPAIGWRGPVSPPRAAKPALLPTSAPGGLFELLSPPKKELRLLGVWGSSQAEMGQRGGRGWGSVGGTAWDTGKARRAARRERQVDSEHLSTQRPWSPLRRARHQQRHHQQPSLVRGGSCRLRLWEPSPQDVPEQQRRSRSCPSVHPQLSVSGLCLLLQPRNL